MPDPSTQPYTVYALVDPRDQIVRYVGISKQVQRRYQEHRGGRSSWLLASWGEALKAQGLQPVLRILEEDIPGERAAESREWHWTKVFLTAGAPLLNHIGPEIREKYTHERGSHMTEQEIQAIERTIDDLARTISSIRSEITEAELRISMLQNTIAALTRLLPTDKRIDRLFS